MIPKVRNLSSPYSEYHIYTACIVALHVGSVSIDELFEQKATEYVNSLRDSYPKLPEHLAHQITRGEFQTIKTKFGEPLSVSVAKFEIPGVSERLELPR